MHRATCCPLRALNASPFLGSGCWSSGPTQSPHHGWPGGSPRCWGCLGAPGCPVPGWWGWGRPCCQALPCYPGEPPLLLTSWPCRSSWPTLCPDIKSCPKSVQDLTLCLPSPRSSNKTKAPVLPHFRQQFHAQVSFLGVASLVSSKHLFSHQNMHNTMVGFISSLLVQTLCGPFSQILSVISSSHPLHLLLLPHGTFSTRLQAELFASACYFWVTTNYSWSTEKRGLLLPTNHA